MAKFLAVSMAVLLAAFPMAQAQQRMAGTPAAQLGFYVGHWSESGRSRAEPGGAYAPLTGYETCEWVEGGQAVLCRETTREAAGTSHNTYLLDWDSAAGRYHVHGVDNRGGVIDGTGELQEGRWTWVVKASIGGDSVPLRFVFASGPAGARDMTMETDDGNGGWTRMSEVRYTAFE